MTTSRRALLGATAAFAALPAAALPAFATPAVPGVAAPAATGHLRRLWDEVIDLSIRLGGHDTPIVRPDTGLPGWMYAQGEAHALGEARYGKLIAILNTPPRTAEDIAIVARAASHVDIENGPRTFGAARLAIAARSMAA